MARSRGHFSRRLFASFGGPGGVAASLASRVTGVAAAGEAASAGRFRFRGSAVGASAGAAGPSGPPNCSAMPFGGPCLNRSPAGKGIVGRDGKTPGNNAGREGFEMGRWPRRRHPKATPWQSGWNNTRSTHTYPSIHTPTHTHTHTRERPLEVEIKEYRSQTYIVKDCANYFQKSKNERQNYPTSQLEGTKRSCKNGKPAICV